MRAVILQHEEHEGEGRFGPSLGAAGFELVHRFREVARDDAHAELVVVLGGTMSAFDTTAHPFLTAELALLGERLRRGAPCLGICLGAQLLARAAGATVGRGSRGAEIGARAIRWTADASRDPVVAATTDTMCTAQWHQDTWTPVPGATLLATSEHYEQQAFRLGASFACQFHLELDRAAFAGWLTAARDELTASGHDAEALLASTAAMTTDDAASQALVDRLAQHFAATANARSQRGERA
jgi:GMP synthase (glutamine-hydrolysing)